METIIEVGFGCLLLGFILGYSFWFSQAHSKATKLVTTLHEVIRPLHLPPAEIPLQCLQLAM